MMASQSSRQPVRRLRDKPSFSQNLGLPAAPLPAELRAPARRAHRVPEGAARGGRRHGPDRAPYSAATWYDWDDGRILVNMDFERLRLTNMRRDPCVAITVIDLGNWYRAVTVLGRVVELREDEGLADIVPRRGISLAD